MNKNSNGVKIGSKIGFFIFAFAVVSSGAIAQEKNGVTPGVRSSENNPLGKHKQDQASAEYHFSMAQAYSVEGDIDQAIEEYKLTLMFDSNSALVYSRLATEYVRKGMLSAAMETCKEALQKDPSYVEARLILAGLYSTAHDTRSALMEYGTILKANPHHEEAVVYKSQVLVESGRINEAVILLRQFSKKHSDSALAWYYLGRAEQQQVHFSEAIVAYHKAMEIKPGFSQAALALGYLYEERKMNSQAIAVYHTLFDDSQDLVAASRLATLYLKQEKYHEAIPYLTAIEVADPDDLNAKVKLGLVNMELKKFDQAISIFKKILEKNPDSDRIHYYLGSLYEETKQIDLAIFELKQIKADSKLYGDAALHTAFLLKQTQRVKDAKSYIQGAINKAPKTPSFYIFQASLEEETKDIPEAITILKKAVLDFPDNEKIRYYLGSLYDRQGDSDKGLEQMEAILKFNPENVDALNYIGYTWTQMGVRLNDAEKLLKRALGLRPDNGYIQDSWGWYLLTRGRIKEAVVELEKAAKLKPNEATILDHLGDAYLRNNLREKALIQYNDAVKYTEDENSKRKIEFKAKGLQRELVEGKPMNGEASSRIPASLPGQ